MVLGYTHTIILYFKILTFPCTVCALCKYTADSTHTYTLVTHHWYRVGSPCAFRTDLIIFGIDVKRCWKYSSDCGEYWYDTCSVLRDAMLDSCSNEWFTCPTVTFLSAQSSLDLSSDMSKAFLTASLDVFSFSDPSLWSLEIGVWSSRLGPACLAIAAMLHSKSFKSHFFHILIVDMNFSRLSWLCHYALMHRVAAVWVGNSILVLTSHWTGAQQRGR